jgi:hypothetical protein
MKIEIYWPAEWFWFQHIASSAEESSSGWLSL